ncbi:alpha/beta fold hydrolase [Geitlerinema sp. PCC 9228]|jgi:pimeloyl-ACP methyl ester carboxylesterase|uniref:alpha/beta fold hydrolase n=1 Tax=Geitlerinema sp. PCC 9228 TaxID=111611 RepID=UPI0008F9C6BD|nr:alpha/beta fold hydrolase [Geitlerinema sp. PCC 9228]
MQTASSFPTQEFSGATWTWRDRSIYYVCAGEANETYPPLLMVHGFGASTDHWRHNMAQLQQDFQVWAIDLLGFGRSDKPDLQYSGDLWRDQLYDFIREKIGRPVVLLGNSLGGYVSLCVAAQKPEAAAGIILFNSAGPFSPSTPAKPEPRGMRRLYTKTMRSLLRQDWVSFLIFQYTRRKSVIRKTLEKVYLDKTAVTDRLVEDIYRPSCDRGAAKVFASVFRTPRGTPVDELLVQLGCPLYTIWGEGDPWMNTRDRGAQFRRFYPQLRETYLQAGHCPHDEVPQQVNQLVRSWVQNHIPLSP